MVFKSSTSESFRRGGLIFTTAKQPPQITLHFVCPPVMTVSELIQAIFQNGTLERGRFTSKNLNCIFFSDERRLEDLFCAYPSNSARQLGAGSGASFNSLKRHHQDAAAGVGKHKAGEGDGGVGGGVGGGSFLNLQSSMSFGYLHQVGHQV